MKKHISIIGVIILSLLVGLLGGCPKPSVIYAPTYMEVHGDYVDPSCGMKFPETVDGFDRINVIHYAGLPEDNVSATYNCTQEYVPMYLTVYVYPAASVVSIELQDQTASPAETSIFERHFHFLISNISTQYDDAVLLTEEDFVLTQPALSLKGKRAVFNYKDSVEQYTLDIVSELYLFEHDGWLIKYRIEYPWSVQSQVGGLISHFMTMLAIPDNKG